MLIKECIWWYIFVWDTSFVGIVYFVRVKCWPCVNYQVIPQSKDVTTRQTLKRKGDNVKKNLLSPTAPAFARLTPSDCLMQPQTTDLPTGWFNHFSSCNIYYDFSLSNIRNVPPWIQPLEVHSTVPLSARFGMVSQIILIKCYHYSYCTLISRQISACYV